MLPHRTPDDSAQPLDPAAGAAPPARWSWPVLLGLALVVTGGVWAQYEPNTFLHGDGNFYATMNRSLADGTLRQNDYQPLSWYYSDLGWNRFMDAGWSNVSLGADGKTLWPKHPYLLPIFAAPLFFLFGYFGLLLANAGLVVASLWFAFRVASRYASPLAAGVVAAMFAALPLFTEGAYSYSNDVFYAALLLAGLEQFLSRRLGWSGLLFGLAIWAKATNVLFVLPFGFWLLAERRWRPLLRFCLAAAVPLVAYAVVNTLWFGMPHITAYHRIVVRENGQPVVYSISGKFGRPLVDGLRSLWQEPFEGLDRSFATGMAMLVGLPLLALRSWRHALSLAVSLALYAVAFAKFEYTYHRFFTPWAAWLVLPGAMLLDALGHVAGLGADLASTLRQRLGRLAPVVATGLAVLLFVVAGLVAQASRRDAVQWRATKAIESAKVERLEPNRTLHCDFFQPRYQKWECATTEGDAWVRWGTSLGDQCRFPGERQPLLWMHPNPNVGKRISFDNVPPGDVIVRYGLAPKSHVAGVKLQVLSDGKPLQELVVQQIGKIAEVRIPADKRGRRIGLEVPSQPYDWRQLCADIVVP